MRWEPLQKMPTNLYKEFAENFLLIYLKRLQKIHSNLFKVFAEKIPTNRLKASAEKNLYLTI